MMLPVQTDFTLPRETRWSMEWWYPEEGYWVFEIVCGSIDAAIAEGRRRMRDFKWLTWRVSPYTECSDNGATVAPQRCVP